MYALTVIAASTTGDFKRLVPADEGVFVVFHFLQFACCLALRKDDLWILSVVATTLLTPSNK